MESWQNYLVVFGVVQRIENMMFFFSFLLLSTVTSVSMAVCVRAVGQALMLSFDRSLTLLFLG